MKVELPESGSEAPSVLSFSMAKAGSTLLYNILSQLAPTQGLVYFSIEDYLFAHNVSPTNRPGGVGKIIRPAGYCYGGFRQYPAFPVPIIGSAKITFLVRDPRDMITSLYFSLLSSHGIPADQAAAASGPVPGPASASAKMLETRAMLKKIDVNAFARQAIRTYMRIFEGYIAQGFARRDNVAIYRYEDVIFAKEAWIKDICEWYGWDVDLATQTRIAAMFDERPDEERPLEHVRQVKPGNHLAYFAPATIDAINDALSEYMRLFGYLG